MDNYNESMTRKKKPKYMRSTTISMAIIFLTIGSILLINFGKEEPKYVAEKGVLDLRDWNMDEDEIVKLDGEWEFYSETLAESKEELNDEIKEYTNVPGSWESYLNEQGSTNGSGTYRLVIKLPEDKVYGIKARTIRVANRIYLNGEEVAHAGNPSLNKEEAKAGSKYNIGVGRSIDREIELIVQVSSYDYRSGGIIKSIELGNIESILLANNRSLLLEGIAVSVCLVLGLYFITLYFQRNREPYLIYFSMTSFFMGLYLSTMNEQILAMIYQYNFMSRTRIQLLSMIMTPVCLLRFTYHFFRNYITRKTVNRASGFMILTLITLINNPEKSISISMGVIQTIIMIGMIVGYSNIFRILVKAIKDKVDSLEYILVITSTMASYWFIIILKIFLEIDLGNISLALILILMFSVASLMSKRLQLDYQELRDLSEKLKRYDKLKDDFLVKSSHELRKPLQVISNATRSLLEGKNGSLNNQQQENLFFIYQEGQRLIRLADDLLEASLIKKDKIKLRLGPVDLYKTVEDILKEIRILMLCDESVLLKNQIPKEFPTLRADPDKIRQIIYDLIHNSIKYTKSGEIVIYGAVLRGEVEIKVTDTGIGIEEKYLKEIFDIFYHKDDEVEVSRGLGLGLPIVKHLVENQGGRIDVESVYGKGSSFKFTLPLYDGNMKDDSVNYDDSKYLVKDIFAEIPSIIDKEEQDDESKHKILIVYDELLSQKNSLDTIKELGYNIVMVNSGEKALDIIENNKIDLVILDFMLSDMSCDLLCNKIRQKYSKIELPILILTVSGRRVDLMSAFNYGANDFQRKPVDSEELRSRIQSLLLMRESAKKGLEREFQYFYSQISPHFLYNTLNSIIGLSYKDSEKTRKALNNLSIYFRGKLDVHRKKGLATLEAELELLIAYLEIEEMRYGEGLEVEYDIEEGLLGMIPPLTLQPIVENSVRHGLSSKDSGVKIRITVKRKDDNLIKIVIEDNGEGITNEDQEKLLRADSDGIGFRSVVERIKILRGAKLTLESKVNEGTKVTIVIPEGKYDKDHFN